MAKLKEMKEKLYENTNLRQRFVLLFLALSYIAATAGTILFISAEV